MLASGSTTRSTELWEMSRSCQSATSSRPADEVAAQHPGQAAQPLGQDRVALVGHGRAALLARLERLLDLADLAARPGAGSRWRSARWWRPTDAHAHRYSAWRSRATTWVAGDRA